MCSQWSNPMIIYVSYTIHSIRSERELSILFAQNNLASDVPFVSFKLFGFWIERTYLHTLYIFYCQAIIQWIRHKL